MNTISMIDINMIANNIIKTYHLNKNVTYNFNNISFTNILKILKHFFPEVEIKEDKYVLNITTTLWDKITEINKTMVNLHKPRPLDPVVSNTISSVIGNLNTLSRKHSELANHVSSLNSNQQSQHQIITPNNTSSELFNARLKKIEDLLNLS
jgi:DNA repair ATPase RecN